MKTFTEFFEEQLKDPEFARIWEDSRPAAEIANMLIDIRVKQNLTQAQLAAKIGTTQSAIARLESGEANSSIFTLEKVAKVLGKKLRVSMV